MDFEEDDYPVDDLYADDYYEEEYYSDDSGEQDSVPGASAFMAAQNIVAPKDRVYSSIEPEEYEFPALRGTSIVERILDKTPKDKALVIFDPDIDGGVAGLFFCWELAKRGINANTYVNPGREHGFLLGEEEARTLTGGTVFAGDFTVTREQVKMLTSYGVSVVCVDHHEFETGAKDTDFIHYIDGEEADDNNLPSSYKAEGVVVNTQYRWEAEENRFQSGAGAVWEVLRRISPELFNTHDAKAMVGWTLLSDIRDISAPAAKHFLWELYTQPYDGWLKKYADILPRDPFAPFGLPRASRQWVDYYLSPKINSLFRFGLEKEAVSFMLGGLYPYAEAQKDQRKLVDTIAEVAHVEELEALTVIAIPKRHPKIPAAMRPHISNFVGLVASNHTNKGRGCVGFVYDGSGDEFEDSILEDVYATLPGVGRASFRSNITGYPYRERFREFMDARGHSMAFGITNLEPSNELFGELDKICVEAKTQYPNILNIQVMNELSWDRLREIAEHNDYSLSSDQILVKYNPWASREEYLNIPADEAPEFHARHAVYRYREDIDESKLPWVVEDQSENFVRYRVNDIQIMAYKADTKFTPADRFLQVFTLKDSLAVTCKEA